MKKPILDSLFDVSDKFLGELRAWLDTDKKAVGYDLIEDEGTALTKRGVINFVGAGVTAADDTADGRTNVTIPGLSTGGGQSSFNAAVNALASSLRGYWRLGESSGVFADSSSSAADLTAAGTGAYTRHVTGLISDDDGAVSFDVAGENASNRWLANGPQASTVFTGTNASFTIVAWAKPNASSSNWRGGVFNNSATVAGSPGYQSGWDLEVLWPGGSGTLTARLGRHDVSGSIYANGTGLVGGTAYFLAATYDGANMRMYVNASLVDTVADTRVLGDSEGGPMVGNVQYIQAFSLPGNGPFYGTIDEVAFFDRPLTGTEISTLYSSGVRTIVGAHKVLEADGNGSSDWAYITPSNVASGYGLPAIAAKTADTTVSAQATPQADPHLLLAISNSATEIWYFEILLMVVSANATMDFKAAFSVPTSCTMLWGTEAGLSPDLAAGFGGDATGSSPVALNTESGTQSFGTNAASGTQGIVLKGFIFGGGTAGNVNLKWSQNTSDAGNLTVKKGSLLRALKIAS